MLFTFLLRTAINEHAELDAKLQPFMDRPIEQLDQTERALLRISTVELIHSIEVPVKVVINEAIELATVLAPSKATPISMACWIKLLLSGGK